MSVKIEKIDLKRLEGAYEDLVNEIGNPITLRSHTKRQRLNDLLKLFEYLCGDDDSNPLMDWFDEVDK
jgi:hypothetical protein